MKSLLTPIETSRLGRLKQAREEGWKTRYSPRRSHKLSSLIRQLEDRDEKRQFQREQEALTPMLGYIPTKEVKPTPFKRYARKPFCG
jgi:hypothetical protein